MLLSNLFILRLILLFPTWLVSFCSTSKSFSIHSKSIKTLFNSFSSENTLFSGGSISFSPELISFLVCLVSFSPKLISFSDRSISFSPELILFSDRLISFSPELISSVIKSLLSPNGSLCYSIGLNLASKTTKWKPCPSPKCPKMTRDNGSASSGGNNNNQCQKY